MEADIELMEAMYPGEVSVEDGIVRLPVNPQVGGDEKAQFISATLVWNCETHNLSFDRCYGLSDDQALQLCDKIDTRRGLFESAQEVITLITELNEQLSGDCPICLSSLTDGRVFRLRGCFHTVHRECVSDYWENSGSQICAVCRRPAEESDLQELTDAKDEVSEDNDSRLAAEKHETSNDPLEPDKGPKGLLLRSENNTDFSEDFRAIKDEIGDVFSANYFRWPVHKGVIHLQSSKQALDWLLENNNRLLSSGARLVVGLHYHDG